MTTKDTDRCTHDCYFDKDDPQRKCLNGLCKMRGCHQPQSEKKCEGCGHHTYFKGYVCDCPCHTPVSGDEWEKEWDTLVGKTALVMEENWVTKTKNDLKSFIKNLLQAERAKALSRGHTWKTEQDAYIEGYGAGKRAKQERIIKIAEGMRAVSIKKTKLDWAVLGDPDQILGYNAALTALIEAIKKGDIIS